MLIEKTSKQEQQNLKFIFARSLRNHGLIKNSFFAPLNHEVLFLPFSFFNIKGFDLTLIQSLAIFLYNIPVLLYWMARLKKLKKFNFIHVNSLALWPLLLVIPKQIKIVVHAREVLKNNDNLFFRIIIKLIKKKAFKIIAIDNVASIPFKKSRKILVINNVFEKIEIEPQKREASLLKLKLDPGKKYISIIGSISSIKGHCFFKKIATHFRNNKKIHFLVIGDGKGDYAENFKTAISRIDNITHLGFIENQKTIYAITDIVFRCDDFLPLGRTVWEGLSAGCQVLIPAKKSDRLDEIKDYVGRGIEIYKARDLKSAASKLNTMIKKRQSSYYFKDKSKESRQRFWGIFKKAHLPPLTGRDNPPL